MKPKFYTLIAVAAITIGMASCKSAAKLYNQGNYDEAVEVAVKKLQKKPGDAEMKTLIQNAYHYAVTDHENRIAGYAANSSDLRYEWIYNEYADLQHLYDAIYHAPEVYELVNPVDYSSLVTSYRQQAGEAHVARGSAWLHQNDRESAKKAYREFQAALNFKPADLKIQQLLDESFNAAVTIVAITQIGNYGFQYSSYDEGQQQPGNEMINSLVYNSGNEFVKFYAATDARNRQIAPDQVIELRLNDINIGRVQESRYTKEVTKEVVTKEIVVKPDSVVKVYDRVTAKITTTRRTIVSAGNLSISIRDGKGAALWNDNAYGETRWANEFSSYTGDKRALGEDDKHLINRKPDNIPGEGSIIDDIKQQVFNNALNRIRNYYSRY